MNQCASGSEQTTERRMANLKFPRNILMWEGIFAPRDEYHNRSVSAVHSLLLVALCIHHTRSNSKFPFHVIY